MKKALLFLIIILVVLCVGCGKNDTNPDGTKKVKKTYLNVAIWASADEREICEPVFKEFEKQNPDIQLFVEYVLSNQYKNKILTSLAGGSGPDVFLVYNGLFAAFQSKNVLYNLDGLIKEDKTFKLNDYLPTALNTFQKDGSTYGIPRDMLPLSMIFYNKKCFDDRNLPYPTDNMTIEDLVTLAQKVTDRKGAQTTTYGLYLTDPYCIQGMFGGDIVNDIQNPTKSGVKTPEYKKGLEYYYDLIYKYKTTPSKAEMESAGTDAISMLKSGNIAMEWSGVWLLNFLKRDKELDFGYVAGPHAKGYKPRWVSGGAAYCINANTKHVDDSWRLLKYLTSEEVQTKMADSDYLMPSNVKVLDKLYIKNPTDAYGNRAAMAKTADYVVTYPKTFLFDKLGDACSLEVDKYLLQKQDIDKTIKRMDYKITEIFAEDAAQKARREARAEKKRLKKLKKEHKL